MKTALVLGSSGLTGTALVRNLLAADEYSVIKCPVRKPTRVKHDKLAEQVTDFIEIGNIDCHATDVFCCLGTTIAKAGNQENFFKIDHDLPLSIAKKAFEGGAKQFLLISAVDANHSSPIFYSKVKGMLEKNLQAIGYSTLVIFRPSFLLGDRKESRIAEKIGIGVFGIVSPLLVGGLSKYKGISVEVLAKAMLNEARKELPGIRILDYTKIKEASQI